MRIFFFQKHLNLKLKQTDHAVSILTNYYVIEV